MVIKYLQGVDHITKEDGYGRKVPLVVYHRNCMDGIASVWPIWKVFEGAVETVSMAYDERSRDFPRLDIEDRHVIIVDFSIQPETILSHAHRFRSVTMLDHHTTMRDEWSAIAKIPDNFYMIYSPDLAGAKLAWLYRNLIRNCVLHQHDRLEGGKLHTVRAEGLIGGAIGSGVGPNEISFPLVTQHIDDRDRWKFEIQGSREVHAYLKSRGFPVREGEEMMQEFDRFADQMDSDRKFQEYVYKSGKVALELELNVIKDICDQYSHIRQLDGFSIPVCAMPYQYASEGGHYLLHGEEKYAFSLTYCDDLKLGVRRYSLRSEGGIDVSAIAKKHGGGGRETTAGFVTALAAPFVFD